MNQHTKAPKKNKAPKTRRGPRCSTDLQPDDRVQDITTAKLAKRFGSSERTWIRERAKLVADGVLVRRGNRIYGTMSAIAAALMGQPPAPATQDDATRGAA